jgi:hypothetical protein
MERKGIQLQTLIYRAPEILFGDQSFGLAVDVWSLGLVLAEMAGSKFHQNLKAQRYTTVDYMVATFEQLGTPDFVGLPLWPPTQPQFKRKAWPANVASCLGNAGLALLDGLLEWKPLQRLTLPGAARHRYFQTELFALGGEPWNRGFVPQQAFGPEFQGARHPWNVRVGQCAPEVLRWLQADPTFVEGSDPFKNLELDFGADRKNAKSEEAKKFILAGAVGDCSSSAMCGLLLHKPLPCRRVLAWHGAFCKANDHTLVALGAAARVAVGRLPLEDRQRNGEHFLTTPVSEWFLTCGELSILNAGEASGPNATASGASSRESADTCVASGLWEEPQHQDGGASILHMGITIFGRRDVRFIQGKDLPDVAVRNIPGSIYFGQVTGAKHQVHHQPSDAADLWHLPEFGPCSVTVMLRTALFPHNRSRMRNTTPSPQCVFEALSKSFMASCGRGEWRLPTLHECEQAFAALPPPPKAKAKQAEPSRRARSRSRVRVRGPGNGPRT